MIKAKGTAWVIVAALLSSSYLLADSINVTITGTSGLVQNGVYVAPYYLNVAGSGDPAQGILPGTIKVICDDYTHEVTLGPPPSAWIAQVNDFTTSGLSQVRFSSSTNAQRLYEEAGWLALKSGIWAGPSVDPATVGAINFAIWSLFDPTLTIDQAAKGWVTRAKNEAPLDLGFYSGVRILTPIAHTNGVPWTDRSSPQEYITVVSEPASLMIFGTGLFILGLGLRKKAI